jgi:hypothetical protein
VDDRHRQTARKVLEVAGMVLGVLFDLTSGRLHVARPGREYEPRDGRREQRIYAPPFPVGPIHGAIAVGEWRGTFSIVPAGDVEQCRMTLAPPGAHHEADVVHREQECRCPEKRWAFFASVDAEVRRLQDGSDRSVSSE